MKGKKESLDPEILEKLPSSFQTFHEIENEAEARAKKKASAK